MGFPLGSIALAPAPYTEIYPGRGLQRDRFLEGCFTGPRVGAWDLRFCGSSMPFPDLALDPRVPRLAVEGSPEVPGLQAARPKAIAGRHYPVDPPLDGFFAFLPGLPKRGGPHRAEDPMGQGIYRLFTGGRTARRNLLPGIPLPLSAAWEALPYRRHPVFGPVGPGPFGPPDADLRAGTRDLRRNVLPNIWGIYGWNRGLIPF